MLITEAIVAVIVVYYMRRYTRVLISRLFEQKNKGISQIKLINIIKQLK